MSYTEKSCLKSGFQLKIFAANGSFLHSIICFHHRQLKKLPPVQPLHMLRKKSIAVQANVLQRLRPCAGIRLTDAEVLAHAPGVAVVQFLKNGVF